MKKQNHLSHEPGTSGSLTFELSEICEETGKPVTITLTHMSEYAYEQSKKNAIRRPETGANPDAPPASETSPK